jgi:uncharacterized protein YbjQ (UPF0145 family)
MILTTTTAVEGKRVEEYLGVVFGEVISGVHLGKDLLAGFRDIFGGRSKSYEAEIEKARSGAFEELRTRAKDAGADAVLGIDIDYETIGAMMMVTVSGTAVKFAK